LAGRCALSARGGGALHPRGGPRRAAPKLERYAFAPLSQSHQQLNIAQPVSSDDEPVPTEISQPVRDQVTGSRAGLDPAPHQRARAVLVSAVSFVAASDELVFARQLRALSGCPGQSCRQADLDRLTVGLLAPSPGRPAVPCP